jgi:hypothetical protein
MAWPVVDFLTLLPPPGMNLLQTWSRADP